MNEKSRNIIKRHAGMIWIAGVVFVFMITYVICDAVMRIMGLSPDGRTVVATNAASIISSGTYLILAFLGMKYL